MTPLWLQCTRNSRQLCYGLRSSRDISKTGHHRKQLLSIATFSLSNLISTNGKVRKIWQGLAIYSFFAIKDIYFQLNYFNLELLVQLITYILCSGYSVIFKAIFIFSKLYTVQVICFRLEFDIISLKAERYFKSLPPPPSLPCIIQGAHAAGLKRL